MNWARSLSASTASSIRYACSCSSQAGTAAKNKAEMRVLEAQIKPHFLFNTLESINVLAVQNEGRKVSQMVIRLAISCHEHPGQGRDYDP